MADSPVAGEPRLRRPVTLAFRGDWGQANMHRICGWLAQEIVSGSFRNIAGLVQSVDPAKNTITVMDLATKKPVTVRITNDSQMHKLPAQMAIFLAMRLKGLAPDASAAGR